MATAVGTSPKLIALDANFIIGFCAKEPDKHSSVKVELTRFATEGAQAFAPGVIISEALFVFCKKLEKGDLNPAQHAAAVRSLETIMKVISPPPRGDGSLISRAEKIRQGRTCRRTTDGIYIALAEELASIGPAELVTFDEGLQRQARAAAPSVTVRLLIPAGGIARPGGGLPGPGSSLLPPVT
jgi:predicted nucleic acid-binding protein